MFCFSWGEGEGEGGGTWGSGFSYGVKLSYFLCCKKKKKAIKNDFPEILLFVSPVTKLIKQTL